MESLISDKLAVKYEDPPGYNGSLGLDPSKLALIY